MLCLFNFTWPQSVKWHPIKYIVTYSVTETCFIGSIFFTRPQSVKQFFSQRKHIYVMHKITTFLGSMTYSLQQWTSHCSTSHNCPVIQEHHAQILGQLLGFSLHSVLQHPQRWRSFGCPPSPLHTPFRWFPIYTSWEKFNIYGNAVPVSALFIAYSVYICFYSNFISRQISYRSVMVLELQLSASPTSAYHKRGNVCFICCQRDYLNFESVIP